ncbi:MAG: signal peptidase I [Candidatus Altiarchaeota archaeon]|nr:signal peptidase I [Candidatus Altiarchaeota archaeon]
MDNQIIKKFGKDLVWAFVVAMLLRATFGYFFGTSLPFVAVMSGSMEHDSITQYNYYSWMLSKGYNTEQLDNFPFPTGFNKGDALVIVEANNISVGDVVVYVNPELGYPIIHRVVNITDNGYTTKGDHNPVADPWVIQNSWIQGKAAVMAPMIGWISVLPKEIFYRIFNLGPL